MILLNCIYFVLISLSVSLMWNFSEIFRPIRNLVSRIPYIRVPLMCAECNSFWFGIFASFLYNPIIIDVDFPFVSNIICGLITYFFAHFLFTKKNKDKINFI